MAKFRALLIVLITYLFSGPQVYAQALTGEEKIFPVRRIKRCRVGTETGGNLLRGASANRHNENFVVRAGCFDFIDVARVCDFLAIR